MPSKQPPAKTNNKKPTPENTTEKEVRLHILQVTGQDRVLWAPGYTLV